MRNDFPTLLAGFGTCAPATAEAIADCERRLQWKLPADYIKLLALTNGGEGFLGDGGYLVLWPIEELAAMNEEYEIWLYLPGFVSFGGNGGGEGYAYDIRSSQIAIVQFPFIGMEPEVVIPLASDFSGFLKRVRDNSY